MITNYTQYLSLIKEGLIRTHNIIENEQTLRLHLDSMDFEYELNVINKFIYEISFFNINKIQQEIINGILPINNLFGYYPSYMWLELPNGMKNNHKFNINDISNKYKNIKIRFESKYEDGAYMNDVDVPPIMYHLTKQKYNEKIEKNGLYPKSYNRKTKHPERIYMFLNLIQTDILLSILLSILKQTDAKNGILNEKYMLLEIKLTENNIIHTDPNYLNGFYTTDNIHPKNIKILKRYL